jgi:hypothetical protein
MARFSVAGALGVAAPPVAATLVLAGGWMTPGYDPFTRTISRLAEPGVPGAVSVELAIVLVGAALLGLAVALGPGSRVGRALLAVAGAGLLVRPPSVWTRPRPRRRPGTASPRPWPWSRWPARHSPLHPTDAFRSRLGQRRWECCWWDWRWCLRHSLVGERGNAASWRFRWPGFWCFPRASFALTAAA